MKEYSQQTRILIKSIGLLFNSNYYKTFISITVRKFIDNFCNFTLDVTF